MGRTPPGFRTMAEAVQEPGEEGWAAVVPLLEVGRVKEGAQGAGDARLGLRGVAHRRHETRRNSYQGGSPFGARCTQPSTAQRTCTDLRAAERAVAAAERAAGLVSHLPEPYRSLYARRAALALERAAAAGARLAAPEASLPRIPHRRDLTRSWRLRADDSAGQHNYSSDPRLLLDSCSVLATRWRPPSFFCPSPLNRRHEPAVG